MLTRPRQPFSLRDECGSRGFRGCAVWETVRAESGGSALVLVILLALGTFCKPVSVKMTACAVSTDATKEKMENTQG